MLTNYIENGKKRFSLLSMVKVESGLATTTNLKAFASQPTELEEGFYFLYDLLRDLVIPKLTPKNTFPEFPTPPEWFFPFSSDQAHALLDAFSHISDDENRYVMNGVYLNTSGEVAATDGRRLYYENAGFPPGVGNSIIPYSPALRRFVTPDRKRTPLEIGKTEEWIWFRRGEEVLAVRLIPGQFSKYQNVIPNQDDFGKMWFEIPNERILKDVKYLNPRSKRLTINHGKLECIAEYDAGPSFDLGDARGTGDFVVAFNAGFLLDAQALGAGKVFVKHGNPSEGPAIIPLPNGAKIICMPMHTS